MSNSEVVEIPDDLRELAGRFARWREERASRKEMIPAGLWESAAALSRRIPVSRVAKVLRLSPGELKRRRDAQEPRPRSRAMAAVSSSSAATTFVELPVGPLDCTDLAIEIVRGDGARLRVGGADTRVLTSVVATFLGA